MRPALIAPLLATAALAVPSVRASGGEAPRALAQAASSSGSDYGSVTRNKRGKERQVTNLAEPDVSASEADLAVRVSKAGAGSATVAVRDVRVLDGLVTASSVRRASDGTTSVADLVVEGQSIGSIADEQSFPVTGGRVLVGGPKAALRVKTDSADIRVAVAKATTRVPDADAVPSPSPTPRPTRTAAPTAAPTTAPTAAPKRKHAPSVRKRLTRSGYAFPVYGKARVADNFGGVRPPPIVTHQGVDIFARFGSPVVAVRDGRIDHVGTLPISGNRLWLHTANGDAFFYAHLSAFASRTRNGERVKAGQVLGFTGNTGDAEPTPPHVHFEVHPGGMNEAAVDPYPIVTAWQDRDDVPPGAWLQRLGADATERPGALVTVRDFIAE